MLFHFWSFPLQVVQRCHEVDGTLPWSLCFFFLLQACNLRSTSNNLLVFALLIFIYFCFFDKYTTNFLLFSSRRYSCFMTVLVFLEFAIHALSNRRNRKTLSLSWAAVIFESNFFCFFFLLQACNLHSTSINLFVSASLIFLIFFFTNILPIFIYLVLGDIAALYVHSVTDETEKLQVYAEWRLLLKAIFFCKFIALQVVYHDLYCNFYF